MARAGDFLREALGDVRGRAAWVVVGCFVSQLALGANYVQGSLAGPMIRDLGWTRADYGLASSLQQWVQAAVSPFIGALCVRFGASAVLSFSVVLMGFSLGSLGAMQELAHFYAIGIALGIALAGVGDITVGASVAEWVARGRGLALGIVYTGANVAGTLFPPLVAAIGARASWRQAVLWLGALVIVAILPFSLFAVRRPRAGEGVAPAHQPDARAGDDRDMNVAAAMRTRSFWVLFFGLFCVFFYFLAMFRHMVLFLEDAGLSNERATFYYSFAVGMGLVSKVLGGFAADRIRPRAAMLWNTGLLTASAFLLLGADQPGVLPLFLVVYGFSAAARDVVYPLLVAQCFGVRYLAEIYGAMTITLLPGTLGSFFAGYLFDRFGSYQLAFASFGALLLVSLLALRLARDERSPEPGPGST